MAGTFRVLAWLGFMALLLISTPALAQEPYKVGITAAITGPAAVEYAARVETFRAYMSKVNSEGGINGHPILLGYEDDRGEPARAATNAKKLVEQEKVVLLVNTSVSATYKPVMATVTEAKTPLLFGGGVCPQEVFPPANPLMFCTTSFAAQIDSDFAVRFMKEASKDKVRLGTATMDIPIARIGIDAAEAVGRKIGIEIVGRVTMPPGTADFTPFSSKLKDAGANWVFAWSPWSFEIGPYEALLNLGWQGNYMLYGHQQPIDAAYPRLNRENLYALVGASILAEGLPELKTMQEVAAKHGASRLDVEGWPDPVEPRQPLPDGAVVQGVPVGQRPEAGRDRQGLDAGGRGREAEGAAGNRQIARWRNSSPTRWPWPASTSCWPSATWWCTGRAAS